ncbi:tetratricopeptide repeat protein [Danxiaibacter flavus]|uniref:Tetratricopeptide repeat protein n=1 Tax=Danxiaibacter flavus TaxID=3049108 RepID=A0ABV3ZCR4_9BACT|nr:tetratricopeptide repeat protein [Chitinophagaceae bacterium DXS]
MRHKKLFYISFFAILLTAASLLFQYCTPSQTRDSKADTSSNNYIGEQSCISCHSKEYNDWKQSDHFMSMLPATDSTVSGDFNNAVYTADGVTNRFFKKDGKFFINTKDLNGNYRDFEVSYIFGYKPLQQYLVKTEKGKMQATRASWDVNKKRWFHQYAGQKIETKDWLHWLKGGQNWNTMCARCHSTNLQKNYFPEADSFHTTYNIVNLNCESCHGPAEKHVAYINGDEYKKGNKVAGSFLKKIDNNTDRINTCAPCHARRGEISDKEIPSEEIMDNYIPEIPSTENFYADGQMNDEDYNYTSFLQSKMYRHNVTCMNCHNPHSVKTVLTGNLVCLQCHEKKYDEFTHTFHATGTTGASCVNCHMPGKLYMGNDFRHDHSFRVPRPDLSVKYGTPNACNNCHTDKTVIWAANIIAQKSGNSRKYHFSEDLIPGSMNNAEAGPHLHKLLQDTAVPNIIKATAAYYLQRQGTATALQDLLTCLEHKDAQVRYRALRSLASFPSDQWSIKAAPLLSDKVRAVRIAAASLFAEIPENQIPTQFKNALDYAKSERLAFMNYQLDFPIGNVMVADEFRRNKDDISAEKYYKRALAKDSLLTIAQLNLASLYNSTGKNDEALNLLNMAIKVEPRSSHLYYSLALLQAEMNDYNSAVNNFAKAIELDKSNPRLYYNYGLMLNKTGNKKQAVVILRQGLKLSPQDADLLNALKHVVN